MTTGEARGKGGSNLDRGRGSEVTEKGGSEGGNGGSSRGVYGWVVANLSG